MPEDTPFDEAGAAAALDSLLANQGGVPDEGAPPVEAPASPPEPVEQAAPPAPPAEEPTVPAATEPEFVPRADLESLLEGITDPAARDAVSEAYKSFNRDYTQKTQSLAAERRRLEGIDPDAARQSIEFFERLQSDRNFALGVHQELSQALEAAGATPAQAAAAATEIQEARTPASYEEYGIDPDNPLARDLAELREWKAQEEVRQQNEKAERAYEAELQRQVAQIEQQALTVRRDFPDFDDDDMDAVYKLAGSMQGDLIAAADYHQAVLDRSVTNYVAKKGKAAPGTAPSPSGAAAHSETPQEFRTTDEAHELAKDWMRARLAQEE